MKTYGRLDVYLHAFLRLKQYTEVSGRLPPVKNPVPFNRKLGVPQVLSGCDGEEVSHCL